MLLQKEVLSLRVDPIFEGFCLAVKQLGSDKNCFFFGK